MLEQTISRHPGDRPFVSRAVLEPVALREPRVAAPASSAVTDDPLAGVGVRLLRGRTSILKMQKQLARLARQVEQDGDADSLEYFLTIPDSLKKVPHLMLFEHGPSGGLVAAVLLFEYRTLFGGTGVFAAEDSSGRRGLLAPPELRARVAAFAARTLIEKRAQIVHLTFCESHQASDLWRSNDTGLTPLAATRVAGSAPRAVAAGLQATNTCGSADWTLTERETPCYLPLFDTFDATLARIGQKTRANLRYYRRRAEADLGCQFEPVAKMSLKEFLAFNRECMHAVPVSLARFRFRALHRQPQGCLRGIRDGQGRWLSLVGTRRHDGFVEIDWQMNRAGLPASSLATVMRAYLIEHEIALGSTRLYIEGGTPQPIGRSFVRLQVCELTLKRRSLYVRLLERLSSMIFPTKNLIGQKLACPELRWHSCQRQAASSFDEAMPARTC